MKPNNNSKNKFSAIAGILFLSFTICTAQGDFFIPLSGPTDVQVNDIATYSFSLSDIPNNDYWDDPCHDLTWYVEGGSVVDQDDSKYQQWIKVLWTTPGTGSVDMLLNTDLIIASYDASITVNVTGIGTPPDKPNASISYRYAPGGGYLERTTNPPAGILWYWQTSRDGVSKANSTTTFSINKTYPYYLRAYDIHSELWSIESQYKFTHIVVQAPSTGITLDYQEGFTRITRTSNSPYESQGVKWYWQSSKYGTSLSNSTIYYNAVSTGNVYLRTYDPILKLWSSAQEIYVLVHSKPLPPNGAISQSSGCAYTQIVRSFEPPTGVQWFWQTSASGTSKDNSSEYYFAYSPGPLYLRAYNSLIDSWSNATTINYNYFDNLVISVRDGDWDDPNTWYICENGETVHRIPNSTDAVTIDRRTVYINESDIYQEVHCDKLILTNGGNLEFKQGILITNEIDKSTGTTIKVKNGQLRVEP